MATANGGRRRVRTRRPGMERLEGRALLNASIDITEDGSLLYRTDAATSQTLLVSRSGDVYTFAVAPGDAPIDVTSNGAGLTVTGSGTQTVTVAAPVAMRIEAASDNQTIRVRSTGIATQLVFQADGGLAIFGDDLASGSGGLRALAAPILVSASAGAESNSLVVDDGPAAYAAGSTPSYIVSASAITSDNPDVRATFTGIGYSGVASLTVRGTSDASAPSPLYEVRGTADGVATTIGASAGPAHRDIAILGTSAAEGSRLAIFSGGSANVWVSSIDSSVSYTGGAGGSQILLESVPGANYGIDSDFVILDGGGGVVDVSLGNFWNRGGKAGAPDWIFGFDPGSTSPYAALRDMGSAAEDGIFFRPEQVHSLTIDGRGNQGASLAVIFTDGDPIPFAAGTGAVGEVRGGLTYLGAAGVHGGSPYALAFVGAPPSGAFASESHTAFPLFRGLIELTEAGGGLRNVAYQLDAAAPLFDDAATVASYRWFYDIMNGAVGDERTLPDGSTVSAEIDSTLVVGSGGQAVTSGWALSLTETNPQAFLASYKVSGKSTVRILRGWSLGSVTTNVNYVATDPDADPDEDATPAVDGLQTLTVEDASPEEQANSDVVRLQKLPPGIAAYVAQGFGHDAAVVSLTGVAGATTVGLDGGPAGVNESGEPLKDILYIDAGGLPVSAANFVAVGAGVLLIPALAADSAPVTARDYEDVQVFNSSLPSFSIQPVAIAAQARVPLADVTAGVVTATVAGLDPQGLTPVIVWGDGSASRGSFQAVPGVPGAFRVIGTHTYANAGVYTPQVFVQGTGTATTTVAGVPITFQVAGASGIDAQAPALSGRLAPGSDSGISPDDAITNVVRPTFTGTSGIAGAWIDVYAVAGGLGGLSIHVGSAVAGADGSWAVTSAVALADGAYTVQALSASTSTWANGSATLVSPLVIDTVGPRILGVAAAPLSDAGLTPYHAVKAALPNLAGGGRHALVIGLGGLGQITVQILTALTGATVIATDMKEDAMRRAEEHGAVTVPAGDDQVEAIRELTGGRGVDAAFDIVGAAPTIRTAQACMAQGGRLTVVGIAGGVVEWSFFTTPYESAITNTYWGSIADLHEVVDMYRAGQIQPEIERYSMDDALEAYRRLEAGELSGRAVVVPHS